ncbi:unnamed protein product [Gulo gulo]|uniref:Uncharacterized protein n=1 Tax=Gulo gulo TaxID=48420 RepID=A0A9X9M3B2_GULGU|nr:unnamed protein product [Gulo gulo]
MKKKVRCQSLINEIELHNRIKGTASPVYFQRKSLPVHKGEKRTWLETNSFPKCKCISLVYQ